MKELMEAMYVGEEEEEAEYINAYMNFYNVHIMCTYSSIMSYT
jgi:hypothetical protein